MSKNPPLWHKPLNLASDLHLGPEASVQIGPDDRVFLNGREVKLNGYRVFCSRGTWNRRCFLPCAVGCPLCARGQQTIKSEHFGIGITLYSDTASGSIVSS